MSRALHHEVIFERPIEQVFEIATTMGHWPRWHPATHAVTGQTLEPGQLGDEADEKMLTARFFPGRIVWRVVACDPPVGWAIIATRIEVPLLSRASVRVEYTLSEHARGTRFHRTFEYRLPRHLWLFDRLYFRKKMESESVEGLRRLRELIEAKPEEPRFGASRQPATVDASRSCAP